MNATVAPTGSSATTALILSGGGARAAYQVGVLAAIAEILGRSRRTPFPIICGTSAGAINAAGLAMHADDFRRGVAGLWRLWYRLEIGDVYVGDMARLSRTGLRWLASVVGGLRSRQDALSMLDNAPLRHLLRHALDFDRIDAHLETGTLAALAINATSYSTGQAVTFYADGTTRKPWQRARRRGERARLGVEHLMASTAIPFIFPAAPIGDDYFMDGSVRQLAPLSPALHLGARRILVIAVGQFLGATPSGHHRAPYPTFAQTASHALSSIFLDNLAADLERLFAVNRLLREVPAEAIAQTGVDAGRVDALVLTPSVDIGALALDFADRLPRGVRALLAGLGAMRTSGSTLMSYLMFDAAFCRRLMAHGRADALARADEIAAFLDGEAMRYEPLPPRTWT
ncbi:MAG: patatin-like phospholipase family protein [Proteobacteria bacterium]|nr:patatin-like phospholipase family protein [Pseudomonadota bacterium]